MGIRFIDLSVPLDNGAREFSPPDITYMNHGQTVERASAALGIDPDDWPEHKAWATEIVTLTTHTGTHIDAPYHYWDMTGATPAKTVDQLPLDWFYGNGVLLDFSSKRAGEEISSGDIQRRLAEINHRLSPNEIVLIRTGRDKLLFDEGYIEAHPGVSAEATRYLIDCGIKVMGTDGYGWDVPFKQQGKLFLESRDSSIIWAAHYVGKELEYCQIEKLANLDLIPKPTGFTVIAFPIKISRAGAAWVRPVAIIEE